MPKLTLQYEGRLLKEYAVGVSLTIGRAPDNAVTIDHPAVSSHHACLFFKSGVVILEDLNSTNGTFVNGQKTTRRVLRSGDVLQVGKHQLVFEHTRAEGQTPPSQQAALRRVAVLQVIAGRADQSQYDLEAHTSLIGTSKDALVRLHGWFKPAVAVAIVRSRDGYVAARMAGRTTINDALLEKHQALQDGDVLNVNGLILEFHWKDAVAESAA
jgi:predicted component of type VI protein secretion system